MRIIYLLFIVTFLSCNSNRDNNKPQESKETTESTDKNQETGVFIIPEKTHLNITTDSIINAVITNNTAHEISMGTYYKFEYRNRGKWEECKFSGAI